MDVRTFKIVVMYKMCIASDIAYRPCPCAKTDVVIRGMRQTVVRSAVASIFIIKSLFKCYSYLNFMFMNFNQKDVCLKLFLITFAILLIPA